jgi:zinc/manganese transport system substrate-binding protein
MKRRQLLTIAGLMFSLMTAASANARLKVAATHPLIGDLARQVGGENIEVVDLLKPGGDLHRFEPSARELAQLKDVAIVFASGKHLESFLDKLRDTLGGRGRIVEVGRTIPSIKLSRGDALFMCCPEHAAGGIDPHWWHSAENMARAARIVGEELAAGDPAHADAYKAGAAAAAKKMRALKSWAEQQLAQIPKSDRKLVTAHAAFSYFCREYGFKSLPLLGLGAEEAFSPQYLTEATRVIRENNIRAVFPEDRANPKILSEIVRATGVRTSRVPLNADGVAPGAGSTFEGMLRHNVTAIVAALKP